MNKYFHSFHPYALGTIILWAFTYVFTRLALQYYSPTALSFIRFVLASMVLLVVMLVTKMPLPQKKDWPWFVACGTVGFFLYMIVFNIGSSYVTAATGSMVIATAPVVTTLLAIVVFGEKLKAYQWVAVGVEFAGIVVLTLYNAVFTANVGILWLLLAAVLTSCYNLLQRKLTRTYSALQTTTYSMFVGTFLLAIFLPQSVRQLRAAPPDQLVNVLVLGLLLSASSYILWSLALKKAPQTSMASNYMFFTPLLTGVLGFVIAGESVDVLTWVGGALIILGAFLFNYHAGGKEEPAVPGVSE